MTLLDLAFAVLGHVPGEAQTPAQGCRPRCVLALRTSPPCGQVGGPRPGQRDTSEAWAGETSLH